MVLGAAVRAARQTVQVTDSVPLEWWCVTDATADHNVSSRHIIATYFIRTITRTLAYPTQQYSICISSYISPICFTLHRDRISMQLRCSKDARKLVRGNF
jgi:hypothetical protein